MCFFFFIHSLLVKIETGALRYAVLASNADVYTSAYFALQNACWGAPKPLNGISWMQAVLSKQKGKLFYFLRNSPYSHSANADIIALYLLVSSNREEKVSCASR